MSLHFCVSDWSGYPAATKERGVRAESATVRLCEPARPTYNRIPTAKIDTSKHRPLYGPSAKPVSNADT